MKAQTLVIGCNGLLGSGLKRHFQGSKGGVIGTTRSSAKAAENQLYLDLQGDVERWEIPSAIGQCFFCAAVTSIAECQNAPAESWTVNVTNTLSLVKRMSLKNVRVTFPSTNLVFDGKRNRPSPEDETNPQVEYGRQKAFVEKEILSIPGERHSILRFSKIIGARSKLMREWVSALAAGHPIHPYSDMVISPVSVVTAVKVFVRTAEKKENGIWQFSGKQDVSYAELAVLLATKMGFSAGLIQPRKSGDGGVPTARAYSPEHTTLDSTRVETVLKIRSPSIEQTIDEILREMKIRA